MRHHQKLVHSGVGQTELPVSQSALLYHIGGVGCVCFHLDNLTGCQRQATLIDALQL